MTRFSLPDGTEAETIPVDVDTPHPMTWVDHQSLGPIWIASTKLTPVQPPLPQEPPIGAVALDKLGNAWQRIGGSWATVDVDNVMCRGWKALIEEWGPLSLMVPDRAGDATAGLIALPWALLDELHHTRVRITLWPSLEKPRTGALTVGDGTAEFTAEELERIAAAAWSGAQRIREARVSRDTQGEKP